MTVIIDSFRFGATGGGTSTFFPTSQSGTILSSSEISYASARAGENFSASPGNPLVAGQNFFPAATYPEAWVVQESFIDFDTSTLVGTITVATLSLGLDEDSSDTDFTVEARLHDWGTTLTTVDWVAGTLLGTKTLLATLPTLGIGATGSYKAMTESGTALRDNINRVGVTRIILCSDRHRIGTAPTDREFIQFRKWDDAALKAKLVVTTV